VPRNDTPSPVIASEARQSRESKSKNQKAKMTEMFKNVVRGFSLVHDPEGSHYKRDECLAMTAGTALPVFHCHCEPKAWQSQQKSPLP